jgi:lysophospholipase L1-like esterase
VSLFRVTYPSLVFLIVLELALRLIWNLPSGYFNFLLPTFKGLYPANATIHNSWGSVPFLVETNSLGLRGNEVSARKTRRRIVTIGDSMTEGFSVDNEHTYPHQLGVFLNEQGIDWEVLNAARAGGSIDKELAILQYIGVDLEPDVVVLTFVTNDIAELEGKTANDILHRELDFQRGATSTRHGAWLWLVTRSASAETLYRVYWNLRIRRASEPLPVDPERRYAVGGGDDFARNVRVFNEAYGDYDGLVMQPTLTPRAQHLVRQYKVGLDRFAELCQTHDARPVLVYFPAYPQVYEPATPMTIRDLLREHCATLDVPFCDLTPVFRQRGRDRVLHLAPLDFHLNPDGYRLMARAVGEFLVEQKLVD